MVKATKMSPYISMDECTGNVTNVYKPELVMSARQNMLGGYLKHALTTCT